MRYLCPSEQPICPGTDDNIMYSNFASSTMYVSTRVPSEIRRTRNTHPNLPHAVVYTEMHNLTIGIGKLHEDCLTGGYQ